MKELKQLNLECLEYLKILTWKNKHNHTILYFECRRNEINEALDHGVVYIEYAIRKLKGAKNELLHIR